MHDEVFKISLKLYSSLPVKHTIHVKRVQTSFPPGMENLAEIHF